MGSRENLTGRDAAQACNALSNGFLMASVVQVGGRMILIK